MTSHRLGRNMLHALNVVHHNPGCTGLFVGRLVLPDRPGDIYDTLRRLEEYGYLVAHRADKGNGYHYTAVYPIPCTRDSACATCGSTRDVMYTSRDEPPLCEACYLR